MIDPFYLSGLVKTFGSTVMTVCLLGMSLSTAAVAVLLVFFFDVD